MTLLANIYHPTTRFRSLKRSNPHDFVQHFLLRFCWILKVCELLQARWKDNFKKGGRVPYCRSWLGYKNDKYPLDTVYEARRMVEGSNEWSYHRHQVSNHILGKLTYPPIIQRMGPLQCFKMSVSCPIWNDFPLRLLGSGAYHVVALELHCLKKVCGVVM